MNVECLDKMVIQMIELDFGPDAFSVLRTSPDEFAREVKTAAVVQWYSEGRISQSKATELLSISRTEFLAELRRRRVPACQVSVDELREELELA